VSDEASYTELLNVPELGLSMGLGIGPAVHDHSLDLRTTDALLFSVMAFGESLSSAVTDPGSVTPASRSARRSRRPVASQVRLRRPCDARVTTPAVSSWRRASLTTALVRPVAATATGTEIMGWPGMTSMSAQATESARGFAVVRSNSRHWSVYAARSEVRPRRVAMSEDRAVPALLDSSRLLMAHPDRYVSG